MVEDDATTRDVPRLLPEQRRRLGEALTTPSGMSRTLLPPLVDATRTAALETLRKLAATRGRDALELGQTLGEGGMGVVRSAVQRAVGRGVAVKSLPPDGRSERRELTLLREAWLTAAIEHPNVVPVHDVIMDPNEGPLVVLKQVQGDTWADIMDDAALVNEKYGAEDLFEFNVDILMQVCQALHYAHSKGILHRDIKPANVMIGAFGEVYLLDWGIGVSIAPDPSGRFALAEDGGVAGTPGYMCPDMLVNDGRGVGVRTDVYLVGATLYRIVMGRPPHEADSYDATLISIWTSQPAFSRDVAPPLRAIIETAMHAEPERRYESVDALRLALYQYLRHRASMRLVDQVERQLEELRALIDEGAGATKQLYQHFGECRFGLREALRGWSDNAHAKRLLCELLDQMIDHLLDNDDPGGAAALLAEHPDASAQLSDRVEQALALQQRRREDLERLEAELDPRLGRGARRAAMVAMGVAWTAAPMLANHIDPSALPRSFNYASPVVLLLVALAVWYRARASLAKTAINRRFLVAMLVGFCAHMIHVLVVQLGGLPLKTELAMGMVSFGAIAAVLAYTAERRLWPVVPIYWAGAIAAGLWRDHSAYVLSFANLVLTLYMLAIWSPQRVAAATDPSSAR